jgi:hypothetical protein
MGIDIFKGSFETLVEKSFVITTFSESSIKKLS